MKIAFLYILSLCLVLFGGYRYVHGSTIHNHNGLAKGARAMKVRLFKPTDPNQDPAQTFNSLPTDDKQSIISVEYEDDDLVIRRKVVLVTNYFITLAYSSLLIFLLNHFKKRLFNYRQLSPDSSCKYLLQGALRI